MIVLAVAAFAVLFVAFVVMPTVIQKRHEQAREGVDFAAAGDE